jgi:hypothetical protein
MSKLTQHLFKCGRRNTADILWGVLLAGDICFSCLLFLLLPFHHFPSNHHLISSILLLHKLLHPVQPAHVLALLLAINVLGHKQRQGSVDATDIQVLLE